MTKTLVTFFFSLVMLTSIVAPTYLVLAEGSCELVTFNDKGEDEENQGNESIKDLEVKVYYAEHIALLYVNLERKKRIRFYSKNYTSYQKKQLSPPPEILA